MRLRLPSLVLLSVVLPNRSNLSILGGLHSAATATSLPIVLLATGKDRCSGIINLSDKTSSCIAGPFNVVRLLTQVGTVLHHTRGAGPSVTRRFRVNRLCMYPTRRTIEIGNDRISLACGRFRLLRLLLRGRSMILAHSQLLGRV